MENDIGELGSAASFPLFQLCFGLVMTLAMLTVLIVTLSFFGYRFVCSFRLFFFRLFGSGRDVNIFSALNASALLLAKDIAGNRKKP